jgi:hypothetical protein
LSSRFAAFKRLIAGAKGSEIFLGVGKQVRTTTQTSAQV